VDKRIAPGDFSIAAIAGGGDLFTIKNREITPEFVSLYFITTTKFI
jgi:hypothetical protein